MNQTEPKKYRIGIDVGTASVAAIAVELDELFDQPYTDADLPQVPPGEIYDPETDESSIGEYSYLAHRLRLFDEPVDKTTSGLVSKNLARRTARMARRQHSRRSGRLGALRDLGLQHGLIGLSDGFEQPAATPLPKIRADAATMRVELPDLMRIILRLSKRRGYKGDFAKLDAREAEAEAQKTKTESDSKAKKPSKKPTIKPVEYGATQLAEELRLNHWTLGQYLFRKRFEVKDEEGHFLSTKLKLIGDSKENNKTIEEVKKGGNQAFNLYASRKMLVDEFEQIWETQAKFHPQLQNPAIKKSFQEKLFYQRPLKSVAGMLRPCSLEPTLPHAPKAQMAFQQFRIEKTLADLRFGVGKSAQPLSPEQKAVIRGFCHNQITVSFKTILDALDKAGCPKPEGYRSLNLESANRDEIKGNETMGAWRTLGQDWAERFTALDDKTQISLINFLADITPEVFESNDWLEQFTRFKGVEQKAKNQQIIDFVDALRHHAKFNRLPAMGFPSGRASYSVKALKLLAAAMAEQNCDEESAITLCYPHASTRREEGAAPLAPSISTLAAAPATGNATVDMALRQIRIAVNEIITEIGCPPSEIVIEMARDMSLGPKARNEREGEIGKNQKLRNAAIAEILEQDKYPTPSRIQKYLLWQQQNKEFCPYCERNICFGEVMSGDTEFEHILPKKMTQVKRKSSELVLAHHSCNQEKGDRTPFQAWGNSPRFDNVKKAAKYFSDHKNERKAKLLRLEDFENEVLTDESIDGFADRQFHQTAWIAKAAIQWMEPLCPGRVSPSRGEMTALLRANWGLNTVIAEDRLANNRKVFDKGGMIDPVTQKPAKPREITLEDFNLLRKTWEGHRLSKDESAAIKAKDPDFDFARQIDKRIDHRHHIIDALVIAMTSRRLFQKMARDYKYHSETAPNKMPHESQEAFEKRMKNYTRGKMRTPPPPLAHLRDVARQIIRNPHITVKTDRYVGGAFVRDTALRWVPADKANHGGKPVLAKRKSVIALLGKSKDEMEDNIDTIVNLVTREAVRKEIASRMDSGIDYKDLKQSLIEKPIINPEYKQPIIKVSCKYTNILADKNKLVTVIHGKNQQHTKHYEKDGYAYLELVIIDGKFDSARSVYNHEAELVRKQPKPDNVRRIYKKDTLWLIGKNKTDKRHSKDLYVVKEIHAGGKLLLIQIYETRGKTELKAGEGLVSVSGKGLLNYELVNP
ncbi:MAG: HNH endonuclease domain-containing protein [Candidatus Pacebacteria bacterium]|nr:HNH endonuclease domain-containing protein [Candidatus Paceibacterota bacterium]